MTVKITPKQSRKINTLIRRCCANFFDGNCLLLDDGETCPCIQLISRYRLYCNYFKNAVLPTDEALYAEIMKPQDKKRCVVCGTAFVPKSNRQKYCPDCSAAEERKKDRLRKQKKRHSGVRI